MNKHQNETESLNPAIDFLMAVHEAVPGITETVLDTGRTADGRSSYEILCDAAEPLHGKTVVDLACGSGRLTELLVPRVGTDGKVIGIDLSKSELNLAQSRLQGIERVQFLRESACRLSPPNASAE
ncbi:MAG: class I SAM-dependent methyltransferase [Victivallaceae bacterium]|nr:class I SAM-dependent methyltransferase [Victivallaceae bacterium]